ncbi:citrate lyase holo-[acyl-carrier protein] synthase [Vibrio sp. SCSIO 43137]|uniref:citrate lyase holo-[acyl-carrier protein] synthase n=1 Tax=Vibrio sp. SCSIO 43137 TaxID=3021011 RepID=UPI002307E650|nr:citrate lyase holo-[acyl-carrier protein] synthase [Vibrio sp. SCSIO 43137]WCE31382.1 citrate lyase holo-[acyl-carrier protein] synthase [Vibrio sp. SCSIO 43137]
MSDLITIFQKHQILQQRARRQQLWLTEHKLPLVTITTHLPDSMIHSTAAKSIFAIGLECAREVVRNSGGTIIKQEVFSLNSDDEGLFAVAGLSASELKKVMIKLEKSHPLGSTFNFDVMDRDGITISRKAGELQPRKCLLCDSAASYCYNFSKHSASELEEVIMTLLRSYCDEQKEAVA